MTNVSKNSYGKTVPWKNTAFVLALTADKMSQLKAFSDQIPYLYTPVRPNDRHNFSNSFEANKEIFYFH